MIVEIIILAAGLVAGIILCLIANKFRRIGTGSVIPILRGPLSLPWSDKPVETTIDASTRDKAAWICRQGIKELSGWNNMPQIDVKFCKPETMPNNGQVSGVFYFDTPNIIYINANVEEQTWLASKVILHELYHLYQVNVFGNTNDTDETVNRWSDEVMDKILFANYYKEKGIMNTKSAEFRCPGKFTQIKSIQFIGTIWSGI